MPKQTCKDCGTSKPTPDWTGRRWMRDHDGGWLCSDGISCTQRQLREERIRRVVHGESVHAVYGEKAPDA